MPGSLYRVIVCLILIIMTVKSSTKCLKTVGFVFKTGKLKGVKYSQCWFCFI